MSTVAGSASAGLTDGPAPQARFLVPSGLARAADGTVYVSDQAAQRIRKVLPDGTVSTVAGSGELGPLGMSVAGGYRDGPALKAAFNHPAGMALGPDGALYIADADNSCIRKLQDGVVTTVAGKPGDRRALDGDASGARLVFPMSLSFDGSGTLWIADYGGGIRYLARGKLGTIRTKSYGDVQVTSVAAEPEPGGNVIAVTPQLVYVYNRATKTDIYFGTLNDAEDGPFGRPDQVVAIGNGQAVFTDSKNNNVRYMRMPRAGFDTTFFSKTIAGGSLEKGILNAGFADGSYESARFSSPRGVALAGDAVIVADAGNHRLRRVLLPPFRRSEAGISENDRYDPSYFEVVYISASNAFWDTTGDDSICAHAERVLNASHKASRPVRCHTVRLDAGQLPEVESYIKTALTFRRFDVLVVGASPFSAALYPAHGGTPAGIPALHAALDDLIVAIKPTGARLVMMWLTDSDTFSVDENLVGLETAYKQFPDDMPQHDVGPTSVFAALNDLPMSQYDTYNDFLEYEKQPGHVPLFVNPGTHFNPRGNAFLGEKLARFLLVEALVK